jgi:hypothetical protein
MSQGSPTNTMRSRSAVPAGRQLPPLDAARGYAQLLQHMPATIPFHRATHFTPKPYSCLGGGRSRWLISLGGSLLPERPIASAPPGSYTPDLDLLASPSHRPTRRLGQYPRHSKSVTSLKIPAIEQRSSAAVGASQASSRRRHRSVQRQGSISMVERDWKELATQGQHRN